MSAPLAAALVAEVLAGLAILAGLAYFAFFKRLDRCGWPSLFHSLPAALDLCASLAFSSPSLVPANSSGVLGSLPPAPHARPPVGHGHTLSSTA